MTDYLRKKDGFWHFVRRVPADFTDLDPRQPVRQSTKIRVADDRTGIRASRVADRINKDLEAFWKALADGQSQDAAKRYAGALRRARAAGFNYREAGDLARGSTLEIVERFEALVQSNRMDDKSARAALLGGEKKRSILLSQVFEEFEAQTKESRVGMSRNQLRIWTTNKKASLNNLMTVVGDKPVTEITNDDVLDYRDWWQTRVLEEKLATKTANKDIGSNSRMLRVINRRHRLDLPDLFAGMRLEGEIEKSRVPFKIEFVQNKLLASGALDELNDEARRILYVVAELGLRPSEVCNLTKSTIHLSAPIPYVQIKPDGRVLKTDQSERDIPLVGVALKAMKCHHDGFPRYRDKGSTLSATLNKFLTENKLRPTDNHTVYSLRHTFKDRLVGIEAPDILIDSLMGHKIPKPKYGEGPPLRLKLKWLKQIAFRPPAKV